MSSASSRRRKGRREVPRTQRASQSSVRIPPLPDSSTSSQALVCIVALACAAVSLSFLIVDFDLWEHLAIGRAIWAQHKVPTTELWTWPTHGSPDVNIEWGFQALLWPLWRLGHLWGVYAWNWLAAGLAFGAVFLTARTLGARGYLPLLLISVGILSYRQRSVGRPETLAAVFLSAVILLLELHRQKRLATLRWIPLIGFLWANSHITYAWA